MRNQVSGALLTAAMLSACATSTAPGAVGVDRSQLLILPSSTVNEQASTFYSKLSSKAKTDGKLNRDLALTSRVQVVARKLIRETKTFRPDAASWAGEVNVFESDELNAFCAPGGKIGVYSGLVRKLDLSDDELAAVIGHEIAHALREHTREKMSQDGLTRAVVQGIAASGSRYAGVQSAAASLGATVFVSLPYSREMELEADVMGLELMARAGYDPRNASNVWKKMRARSGGSRTIDFLSTHPSDDRRIADLDAAVPKVMSLYANNNASNSPLAQQSDASSGESANASAQPKVETSSGAALNTSLAQTRAAKPSPIRRGQDSIQVERMAKAAACHPDPRGALTEQGPGFETYSVQCASGEPLLFRCEFGKCRVQS